MVLAVAGAGVALTVADGGEDTTSTATTRPRRLAPLTTTTTTLPDRGPFTVATASVPRLEVYAAASPAAPVIVRLGAATSYGLPSTLLVDPAQAQPPAGFVAVLVPLHKPNDTAGWVKAADVTLSQTSYAIDVSLSEHTLVLRNAGTVVLSTQVIIGAPESPTPTGRFFLTDPVNCNTMSVPGYPLAKCGTAYGAFAIGTSGLSEKLDSFLGTVPQIAIHGTALPASELGKDLSNGCVRMPNEIILQIAKITPLLGTPVTISA